ncbi:MAG: carboxypeptidase-like regulatory domain-containing protein [Armatimonadota bacterium]|jgi:hypothetical protein
MQQKLTRLMGIAIVTLILAGCGGGGALALLGLIGIGNAVGQIGDLFSGDSGAEAEVLLDGQLIRTVNRSTDTLRLRGLPEGRHLLQVVAGDFRGILRVINVDRDSDLQLGQLQAEDGGQVRGSVMLRDGDGSIRAAVRVPVYAVPGGAASVAAGQPATAIPPAGTHYVAYTDGNGNYSLSAMAPGDYLVTAAVAGYMADVQLIQGLQVEQRQRNRDLELIAVAGAQAGRAVGVVQGQAGGGAVSLAGASLRARLATAYAPGMPQATIDRIESSYGGALRAAPWFRWQVLSTLADAGGSYELALPAGTPRVDAFSYGYQPAFREPVITAGLSTPADFTLNQR